MIDTSLPILIFGIFASAFLARLQKRSINRYIRRRATICHPQRRAAPRTFIYIYIYAPLVNLAAWHRDFFPRCYLRTAEETEKGRVSGVPHAD